MIRRLVLLLVFATVVVGAVFLGSFPFRMILDQREATASAQQRVDELEADVAALDSRRDALSTAEEVERLARERYDMVRPGEEPYRILPQESEPLPRPEGWPFVE